MPQQDEIPDLWKKSSLHNKQDLNLPILLDENYNVKKIKNQQGQIQINQYVIKEELGRGAFGEVYKCINKNSHKQYAMKIYNLFKLQKHRFFAPDGNFANGLQMLQNQLNIIKRLKHPNIPQFYQILHGQQQIYLIHQLCTLGQIMYWDQLKQNYIRNKKITNYIKTKYNITQLYEITKIIFIQLCSCIKYLHNNNITNRDIKIDNILCNQIQIRQNNSSLFSQIKLIDFTTIRYSIDDISYFPSGTPGFRGPQHQFASQQGYSSKASDIWSIGISMYTYYYQNFPFYGQTQLQVDIKAKNNQLIFDQTCPQWLKSLIEKMTQKDWKKRMNIDQVLEILLNKN